MHICNTCKLEKEEKDFYPYKYYTRNECKDCTALKHGWYKYKLSIKDNIAMRVAQNNKCAMCKENKKLCVDHNHLTGEVRGLVCHRCNIFIAMVERNTQLLEKVKSYLCLNGMN